jgi:two-component system cell cycle response regulator
MGRKYTFGRCGIVDSKILIQKIVKQIDFIENLYDYIRLVDPMQKKIYSYSKIGNEEAIDINEKCYMLWGKSKACENCSSMRTLNYKRTIVKIEYNNGMVYLITSVPIEYEGAWLVVELIKDIIDDGIIVVERQEVAVIRNMVDRNNSLVVRDAFTRIYNEKYIYDKLPLDILKAKEENRKLALLIISINNFKDINNLYGFKTGDEIIKEFSKKIKNYCRKDEDWAARYSGLEFVLVMFVLKGHTNIEIAEILFVGLSTVKKHVANIFEKSNVKSRTEFISRIKMQI